MSMQAGDGTAGGSRIGTPTREAAIAIAGGGVLLGGLCPGFTALLGLPDGFAAGAWVVYLPGCGFVLAAMGDNPSAGRFGWPNLITLLRLVLASLFGGLAAVASDGPVAEETTWTFLALAGAAIALDGLDGWLARKLGMETAFGARFDMEVDALLILILSLLAWLQDKAGPWVLAIGLARYAFVAAGWVWPVLTGALPPSWRRKAICVVQCVALGVLLTPLVRAPESSLLAGFALVLIVYSFTIDVVCLLRRDA